MYKRWLNFVNSKKVILASGSIHRRNILEELGFKFEVMTSNFPETLEKTNSKDYVEKTCKGKFDVFLKDNSKLDCDILITADSIIDFKGTIREKPADDFEVTKWFKEYSNNGVKVLTSVIIGIIKKDKDGNNYVKAMLQSTPETIIWFQELTDDIISDYIKSGEPYNKAGGIGIQGIAKTLITKIDGCFYNVIGLPVQIFSENLIKLLVDEYGKDAWDC